jgi:uncharacterized protein (TIGR02217 family)
MSNQVYPSLLGFDMSVKWKPTFANLIQQAVTGAEVRILLRSYPIYDEELKYEFLRSDSVNLELQTLVGFFLQRSGSADSFLWIHPEDNSVTAQNFGTGDGNTTAFPLVRAYGGYVEPVMWPNVITGVYLNGVPTGAYTLGALGVITFTTAPGNGVAITWTGTYYYRARFLDDLEEFERFANLLWSAGKVQLRACLGNKIP